MDMRKENDREKLNRQFGFVFSFCFFLLGLIFWIHNGSIVFWAFGSSVAFMVLSFTAPAIFNPLLRVWLFIGKILHGVTNPLILFLMFFLVFCPIGLIFHLFRRDVLGKGFDKNCETYWINRNLEEVDSNSMKNRY